MPFFRRRLRRSEPRWVRPASCRGVVTPAGSLAEKAPPWPPVAVPAGTPFLAPRSGYTRRRVGWVAVAASGPVGGSPAMSAPRPAGGTGCPRRQALAMHSLAPSSHSPLRLPFRRLRGHLGDSFPPTVAQCPRRRRLPGRCSAWPAGLPPRRLWRMAHPRPEEVYLTLALRHLGAPSFRGPRQAVCLPPLPALPVLPACLPCLPCSLPAWPCLPCLPAFLACWEDVLRPVGRAPQRAERILCQFQSFNLSAIIVDGYNSPPPCSTPR